jgi:hypothetical protein
MLQDIDDVPALVAAQALRPPLNDYPEKVVERTQVLHRELTMKGNNHVLEKGNTRCRQHDVVDVEEVDSVIVVSMDEQGCVRLGLDETKGDQAGGEATIPGSWGLLKTIQRAIHPAD